MGSAKRRPKFRREDVPAVPNAERRKRDRTKTEPGTGSDFARKLILEETRLGIPDVVGGDEFELLVQAWAEEFGLVSVSSAHVTRMTVTRFLNRVIAHGLHAVKRGSESTRVGNWINGMVENRRNVGGYIPVITVTTSNKLTYQRLPERWIAPALLQCRLGEAAIRR